VKRRARDESGDDLFGSPPPPSVDDRIRVNPPAAPGESRDSAIDVSMLTGFVKSIVEGSVPPIWVRGEITGYTAHRSGHWYFTLRDAGAQLRCVIWATDARRMPAKPDDGMQVVVYGRLSVYAARAEVQLAVTRVEAEGDGLWRKAFEESRARLAADGLLAVERKRQIPRYPRRIAVVTSPDGAALHDIVAIARRRDPAVFITVVPATVQGEGAPRSIVMALRRIAKWRGADLVIVGRGGGSREDLRAFNDERVARAIAACPLPTISAVGHEVDVTLCDLVADVRAATPSAAAETAVPMRAEIVADVERAARRLRHALSQRAERARSDLARSARGLAMSARRTVEVRRAWISALGASIDALSPLRTLDRGYAVARDEDGRTLSRVADFDAGRQFSLVVRDGKVRATTMGAEPDEK
jgi:exodeoxyribonuclease VII large subunit